MVTQNLSNEEFQKRLTNENGSVVIPEEMKGVIPEEIVTQCLLHIQAYRSDPSVDNLIYMTTDMEFLGSLMLLDPMQVKAIATFSKSVYNEMEE